ncbi:hypothetical protein [Promineifilum sp.]|uniref:hypothetical protein n=1 Tax=Promineifilum sp. TaxID=2664178 RepID=UPI0035B06C64
MDYYTLPTHRLQNDYLTLDYLAHAGPRIVRLIPHKLGQNLLAEVPEAQLPSPYGPFHLWGGHRLWHAPETAARTYVPDDGGLQVETRTGGARLTCDEPHTGMRKELVIALHPQAAQVRLTHRLTNLGLWAVELAPWAITQLRTGGEAILPTPGQLDAEGLLPNRLLVLWPYSRWDDPRLRLTEEAIEVAARPLAQPFKVGYMNHAGHVEYRYQGVTFRKRFDPQPDRPHVDFGCNVEVYTSDKFLELETLGPLVRLEPGEVVEHVEVWEVEESV